MVSCPTLAPVSPGKGMLGFLSRSSERGELQGCWPVWGHQPQSGATCDAGLTTDLGRENSTRGQRHQGGHRYVIIQGGGEINQCDKAKTLQDNDDNKSDKI